METQYMTHFTSTMTGNRGTFAGKSTWDLMGERAVTRWVSELRTRYGKPSVGACGFVETDGGVGVKRAYRWTWSYVSEHGFRCTATLWATREFI